MSRDERGRDGGRGRARGRRVRGLARRTGAAARRARPAARRGAPRREGGSRRARHARGREDRAGRARRGAGDDRHLRLRRRALAAALRQVDRVRASRPSPHRDVAPARTGRRDQRVQFPRRGLELERCARARLRRSRDLEALGADAAHGHRNDLAPPSRRRPIRRRPRRPLRTRARRRRPRRAARRRRPHSPRLRDGVDRHGQGDRAAHCRAAREVTARARRQQRRDRRAERRSRPCRPRGAVRRRRHRGPALHLAAAADRPKVRGRRALERLASAYRSVPIDDPRGTGRSSARSSPARRSDAWRRRSGRRGTKEAR